MTYDTPGQRELPVPEQMSSLIETMMMQAIEQRSETAVAKKPGRPNRLSNGLLAAGILWCLLHGWVSQWDLWRRVSLFGVGSLAAVPVCDQAIYNRLAKHGTAMMQQLCAQVSSWLWHLMAPYEEQQLAPFATHIYALDESTMRTIKRWLTDLRAVPLGDASLLAGRLVGLFDVRRHQWVRIDWLPKAIANCQVHAQAMLSSVEAGTLLLFDLGYYKFAWFDSLTQRGIWWVARLRSNGSFVLKHVLVQRDGYFEALIFLGAHRSNQAASLVRLVRVRYRGAWYSYISNVTDPSQLSGAQIVALYARRWDIELGFRLLKDHLGLGFLWSAKVQVIGAQLWATVILAQLLHALQIQIAFESGVETFDVSLELLWRYLPELAQLSAKQGTPLLQLIKEVGVALKLIRP
ncbi:MAG TPA: IS4 family transposase, partial [Ktedonobacteraceae bacterium]